MAINFVDGKYVDEKGFVKLDPTIYKDWQIAEEAEKTLPPVEFFREKLGLLPEEIIPYGKTPNIDFIKVMERLKDKPDGKFIEVTAVTPTPFGEGKSTVSLGLIEGLGYIGKNAGGALRQPSGGPTMNVKGTAAGGGNALLMPMTEFSLGLTGDINDIINAHNLAMVALTARMQHERNNNDEWLALLQFFVNQRGGHIVVKRIPCAPAEPVKQRGNRTFLPKRYGQGTVGSCGGIGIGDRIIRVGGDRHGEKRTAHGIGIDPGG